MFSVTYHRYVMFIYVLGLLKINIIKLYLLLSLEKYICLSKNTFTTFKVDIYINLKKLSKVL